MYLKEIVELGHCLTKSTSDFWFATVRSEDLKNSWRPH